MLDKSFGNSKYPHIPEYSRTLKKPACYVDETINDTRRFDHWSSRIENKALHKYYKDSNQNVNRDETFFLF